MWLRCGKAWDQALQPIDSSHEHLCSFQWCRVRGRISDVMETAEGVVMMDKMMRQYHILKRERDGFQKVPAYPECYLGYLDSPWDDNPSWRTA